MWAGSYVAMKFAGAEMPAGVVVTLRYGFATLVYLLLIPLVGPPRIRGRDWWIVGGVGVVNFALSPVMQVTALQHTQAVDVAILVVLEPAVTVALAALLLRERLGRRTLGALALGLLGMLILSGTGAGAAGAEGGSRLFGNALFTASLLSEVAVTIAGGRLAPKYPALSTIAAMKACGFLVAAAVYLPALGETDFSAVSPRAWASLAYLALFASLFAYAAWYRVLRTAPVNQVALSLFVQPLIGSAIGYFLAGERIGWNTMVGALLICGGLAWQQASLSRRRRGRPRSGVVN